MINKTLATVAVAASAAGAVGVAAAPAMAIGGDLGPTSINTSDSDQMYGNTTTGGYMSPNLSLINGSLNKPCLSVPPKADVTGLIGVDVESVLSSQANQACTEGSTLQDGDDPLADLLSDLSLFSENGLTSY